jgi:hypothetical protein
MEEKSGIMSRSYQDVVGRKMVQMKSQPLLATCLLAGLLN